MDSKINRILRQGSHTSLAKRNVVINAFRIQSILIRGTLAEFLSAFVFIFVVESTIASAVLTDRRGDMLLGALINGIAVTFAMYISGGVSGAFLNPAVTLVWAVLGKLRWTQCICYSLAQYLGAFAASAMAYITHYDTLQNYDGGVRVPFGKNGTAGLYGTYPLDHMSVRGGIVSETVATALLLIAVLAISDRRNWRPDNGLFPMANGMVIMTLNLAFHGNGGVAMNPARDLSPRLFSYFAGWGEETLSFRNYQWFWIPLGMSYAGALIGAFLYELFIEFHWPPKASDALNEISATEEVTLIKKDSDHAPPILAYGSSPVNSHTDIKPGTT